MSGRSTEFARASRMQTTSLSKCVNFPARPCRPPAADVFFLVRICVGSASDGNVLFPQRCFSLFVFCFDYSPLCLRMFQCASVLLELVQGRFKN